MKNIPPTLPPTGYNITRAAKAEDNPNLVLVRNDSGADVVAASVLGISGVVNLATVDLKLFKNRLIFTGVTPTTAASSGKFVITLKAIKSGQIGLAYVQGIAPVQVNITNTAHNFADVTNSDSTQLTSSSSPKSAYILSRGGGTGTQWCWVRMENGCS